MMASRRSFLAALSAFRAALAQASTELPAHRNIGWALSSALWAHFPACPVSDIFDVMRDTGFIGLRIAGFRRFMRQYELTPGQLQREISRRNLRIVTVSWNAPLGEHVLESARDAMKFLADFGATHLVVFSPTRTRPENRTPAAFRELCARCNQIGEVAREMGFTAGLHNHLGQMVQTREEIDRFMSMTDPKLFGLSPDTAHLHLAGCDVAGTISRYKHRIRFLDYKDARWTVPARNWVLPNGTVLLRDSPAARFYASIYDLGDGEVDFRACHRILKSVNYRGWICVDLDTVRHGPLASYRRCGDFIVKNLQPIYL
jgi:inosose dehydratase